MDLEDNVFFFFWCRVMGRNVSWIDQHGGLVWQMQDMAITVYYQNCMGVDMIENCSKYRITLWPALAAFFDISLIPREKLIYPLENHALSHGIFDNGELFFSAIV